jgi:hypothetical protein
MKGFRSIRVRYDEPLSMILTIDQVREEQSQTAALP